MNRTGNLILALLLFSSLLFSQDFYPKTKGSAKERTFGIGGQASYPVGGVSVKFNIGDHAAVQGVFGFFGIAGIELKSMMLRGLFRFNEINSVEPYVYGTAGYLEITSNNLQHPALNKKETFPGYGVGGGIEYESQSIPDVAVNAEVGYGSLQNKTIDFEFSRVTYGAGIHFYFMR
ncbi:MAG: hypothetical protein WCX28_09360 [Bacteriovoracaceae bacterium]|nr:porin family protein [Bacteroidota bacterium]